MDPELLSIATKGGPYALIIVLAVYTHLEFNRLQRERDTCKRECDDRFLSGDKKFDAIMSGQSEIKDGQTEIKVAMARLEGRAEGKDEFIQKLAEAIHGVGANAASNTQTAYNLQRPG